MENEKQHIQVHSSIQRMQIWKPEVEKHSKNLQYKKKEKSKEMEHWKQATKEIKITMYLKTVKDISHLGGGRGDTMMIDTFLWSSRKGNSQFKGTPYQRMAEICAAANLESCEKSDKGHLTNLSHL